MINTEIQTKTKGKHRGRDKTKDKTKKKTKDETRIYVFIAVVLASSRRSTVVSTSGLPLDTWKTRQDKIGKTDNSRHDKTRHD